MKVEDILAEIYRRKEAEIDKDRKREKERLEKEVKGSSAFKQAAVELEKLLRFTKAHGLRVNSGASWLDEDNLKIDVRDAEVGNEFKQREEKLDKALLDLKIVLATAGKSDQQSLIKAFAEGAF
jgi:hypothetical protein